MTQYTIKLPSYIFVDSTIYFYFCYRNKFVEPSVNEGFKEVIDVPFSPRFKDKESEEVYRMYLLEK